MADRGTDAAHLPGGDRGADAGAADEDAALRVAALDRLAELARLVRIVDPHRIRVVPRSTISWPSATSAWRISSRRCTPRWSNATATFTASAQDTRVAQASARARRRCRPCSRTSRAPSLPGADAPKCSIEIESPSSPTHCFQPSATPASTERRAFTSGGSTSSRYSRGLRLEELPARHRDDARRACPARRAASPASSASVHLRAASR